MKELLPIPLNLPRQHEIQQRHDSLKEDLDNLWFIKWKLWRLRVMDVHLQPRVENVEEWEEIK